MLSRSFGVAVALVATAWVIGPARAQSLKLGDQAPDLKISDWVKGDAVDIKKGKDKNVFLIEFWATWCPPCIESIPHVTELQRKYKDDGLVILAVAGPGRGETLRTVKRFVKRRGDDMGYVIAYDGSSQTSDRYMGGVGANGLPWAFLVDREGKLVWHGHPGNPIMDEIVGQVISGKYDATEAIMQERLAPMFSRLNGHHRTRNWPAFKSTAKTILAQDPKNDSAINALVYACLIETDDADGLRDFVNGHTTANRHNAEAMNALALALLSVNDLDKRQPELALKAATVAYEACKGGDCKTVDTYARAVFEIGMVDRAIELQAEAIALASGDKQRSDLERVAEYYRTCKALQSESL